MPVEMKEQYPAIPWRAIADIGNTVGLLRLVGLHLARLLARFKTRNGAQRHIDVRERRNHRAAIIEQRLLLLRDGDVQICLVLSAVENRLQQRCADRIGDVARVEQARQNRTRRAQRTRQRNRRSRSGRFDRPLAGPLRYLDSSGNLQGPSCRPSVIR